MMTTSCCFTSGDMTVPVSLSKGDANFNHLVKSMSVKATFVLRQKTLGFCCCGGGGGGGVCVYVLRQRTLEGTFH